LKDEEKMQDVTTIKKLFDESDIQFVVPAYQRAYSWEVDSDRKQVKQFLSDLLDQIEFTKTEIDGKICRKDYFLGHFLFETDEYNKNKFWIIDGQQRLTTVIIFIGAIIYELEKRKKIEHKIIDLDGKEIRIHRIKENYLIKDECAKFEAVAYDNSDFYQIIYENNNITAQSTSIKRVQKAYSYFKKQLERISTTDIVKLKDSLDNTVITTFKVDDKIRATQIFAFQNDRGKDLTSLEKIKAYLMHKIYSVSNDSKSATSDIKQIETIFADIYKLSEEISYDEDSILSYHCDAYLSLNGTSIDRVKQWVKRLSTEKSNINKCKKIKKFCVDLKETFITIKRLEKLSHNNSYITDCLILKNATSIPLFIKLYHFNGQDDSAIQTIAKMLENILFKMTYTIADYRTDNIPRIALEYDGDIKELEKNLYNIQKNGFQVWWEFSKNCKAYFEKNKWHYQPKIKYVLWKYENYRRQLKRLHAISPVDFKNKYAKKNLENTIDHITPQNPNFTEYGDEFKEKYLNCIGNLALITWGNNSQKSNNNPVDEIDKYDSDYISHQEIRDLLIKNRQWTEIEITDRMGWIIKFINDNWNLA